MQAQAGMEEERWTEQRRWEGRTQAEEPFSVFCLFGSTSSYVGQREEKKKRNYHQSPHQGTSFLHKILTAAPSSIWKSVWPALNPLLFKAPLSA